MIGTTLGAYRILGQLGQGGMGDVYRARDDRLDRDVAIKTLPPEISADAERLERFEREAKVLASLHHPRIASIFGFEQAEGQQFLVLELVAGENLAQRLQHGPIPPREALPIALQIAEGLEAAHESGIVHRDLKPANIMLGETTMDEEDRVKILDFGLAKAVPQGPVTAIDLSTSPTLTGQMTQAGMILGTAAYMSPEQARGKAVDKRADIWAFGCVVYEMLTGKPAFEGSDVAEILSAVIRAEPDWSRLPAETPLGLRRLLERALRKSPRDRLRDVGDARIALVDLIAAPEKELQIAESGTPQKRLPWVIAGLLATTLVAVLSGLLLRPSPEAPEIPLRRFSIEIPSSAAPNWTDFAATLSADGSRIAYNCRDGNEVSICVRSLDSLEANAVVEARDADLFFFSPDGEWLAYYDRRRLAKISVYGGEAQEIFERSLDDSAPFTRIQGFDWTRDDTIFFCTETGLYRVLASGGMPEYIGAPTSTATGTATGSVSPSACSYPHLLPGAERVLLTVLPRDQPPHAALVELDTGELRDLPLQGVGFLYSATGHLLFQQQDQLLAATFDLETGPIVGTPRHILNEVLTPPFLATDGTLLFIPTRGDSEARLVWVDRLGRPTAIADERRNYSHLDLSPDGKFALLDIDPDIYVRDLERGTRSQITQGWFPIWSSDGRRVTTAALGSLVQQAADGNDEPEILVAGDRLVPTSWNARTGDLAYYSSNTFELWILPPEREPFQFPAGDGRKRSGRFSPDGKWLAFVSDDTGEYQVYVTAYPGPGPKIPVSVRGGLSPIWSEYGSELFFRRGGKVIAVSVNYGDATYGDGIELGAPEEFFDGPYTLDLKGHQRYDAAPDGQSFLMVENRDDFPIVVVQNFTRELVRLAPTR